MLRRESVWLRGRIAIYRKDFPTAIELLHRVVDRSPQHKGNNDLGYAYMQVGNLTAGNHYIMRGLYANIPAYSLERRSILNNAACVSVTQRQELENGYMLLREALLIANRVDVGPYVRVARNLAGVLVQLRRYDEALEVLKSVEHMDSEAQKEAERVHDVLTNPYSTASFDLYTNCRLLWTL